jgi:hypothetical protein
MRNWLLTCDCKNSKVGSLMPMTGSWWKPTVLHTFSCLGKVGHQLESSLLITCFPHTAYFTGFVWNRCMDQKQVWPESASQPLTTSVCQHDVWIRRSIPHGSWPKIRQECFSPGGSLIWELWVCWTVKVVYHLSVLTSSYEHRYLHHSSQLC